jgi:hypothetical protein
MTPRSPVVVFLLTLVTFGLYMLWWMAQTKEELNARGADVPTAWLQIVPFINLWWLWRYCGGVEIATEGRTSTVLAFVMLLLLPGIGMAVLQSGYNRYALVSSPAVA